MMKTPILLALSAILVPFSVQASEAPEDVTAQLEVLLEATQNNDLEKFESVCNETMQEAITPAVLTQVSKQIAELLEAGYTTSYMGDLDRLSHTTYYWKVDFEGDKAADKLAELSVADGKVAGFYIR